MIPFPNRVGRLDDMGPCSSCRSRNDWFSREILCVDLKLDHNTRSNRWEVRVLQVESLIDGMRHYERETCSIYLGSLAIIDHTACVGSLGVGVNHAVVGARHLVSDRPDITVVVEGLAVVDDISNVQDGNDSDRDRQLDIALLIPFQDLNSTRLGQSSSLLIGLVNAFGLLSSRADIGDG